MRVDAELLEMHREYLFRKSFGGSHEDYLDELRENVSWMLLIQGTMNEAEAEMMKNPAKKPGRRT